MLNVVCLEVGNYQGRGTEYVDILYDSVRRNLKDGLKGKFICFTDSPGVNPGIEYRSLPVPGLKGWWNKLALFKAGLFPDGDRVLYLDLDTVIAGPLDQIAAYEGPFAILRDFNRPNGLQSSIMAWEANTFNWIWANWEDEAYPEFPGGDQHWIEIQVLAPDRWQNLFPGQFVSYKVSARDGVPKGANVIVMHGRPRPHEIGEGWVPLVWKIGGGTSATLELVANTNRETMLANVRHALSLKARTLRMQKPNDREAVIVAGGPSLNDEVHSLKAHIAAGAEVYAVNNSWRWLMEHGIFPDAQVMSDARPDNVEFTPHESYAIERFYASQCHASVLARAGENLTLWHLLDDEIIDLVGREKDGDFIGGGTTTGLHAIVIAFTQGFRTIHLYGFDSSYRGKANHAYAQPLNDGERIVEAIVDGKTFRAAPWMVTQLEDFRMLMPELLTLGCEIHVHGDGMLPAAAAVMARNPVLMPPDIRAQEILKRVNGAKRGAEIGVFSGDLSKRLLSQRPDLTLYMVDSWSTEHTEAFADSEDFHGTLGQDAQEYFATLAKMTVSFAEDRAIIIRKDSKDAAAEVPDESLDFVFIDADHSYEGCSSDIRAWFPKVKQGGIISGHDYANNEFKFGPMVKRAVDEFISAQGLALDLGENFTWFAKKETSCPT